MTLDQFKKLYNPKTRCYVTYHNVLGDKLRGLLLDDVQKSTNNNLFCFVENFSNRVMLESITDIQDTQIPWIKN